MKRKYYVGLIALLALVLLFSGCTSSGPESSPEASGTPEASAPAAGGAITEEDVAYAGPMVDNMLAGIEQGDFAMFSRDLSDTMKAAFTEDAFDSLAEMLGSTIGNYQSKSFGEAAETTQNGVDMTVIIYTAKYSDEPSGVIVTVSFSGEQGNEKVEGLYFNSPKLRGE